jgi:hypothetical protein
LNATRSEHLDENYGRRTFTDSRQAPLPVAL